MAKDDDPMYDVGEESRLTHVGFRAHRTTEPAGELEAAFASRWYEMHEHDRYLLEKLLHGRDETFPISQAQASAVATVVQWLGTNCGFSFLVTVLKQCNYEVREHRVDSE